MKIVVQQCTKLWLEGAEIASRANNQCYVVQLAEAPVSYGFTDRVSSERLLQACSLSTSGTACPIIAATIVTETLTKSNPYHYFFR
ncbi:hypothetical protein [Paracoccus albus]|uniref:hypothetical protein n=1 Tax=Paracoccus albus TaxID=3017784 RepID=UPI0022F0306A|nr:hypothetical protein [Paracoccus albus]WBU61326.1 hypothetical protein PAF20_05320 [Paracoccus albus]